MCLTVHLILCSDAASLSHRRLSGKAWAVSFMQNTNAVFGTLNCSRGTNVLSTIQLFNLVLVKLCFVCVTFVDAKAVDDKFVPGIGSVAYGGILPAYLYLGKFKVKTSITVNITVK